MGHALPMTRSKSSQIGKLALWTPIFAVLTKLISFEIDVLNSFCYISVIPPNSKGTEMPNTEQLIREIAAKHDAKLRTVLTDAELRANNKLIDQILASLGTLTWSKNS